MMIVCLKARITVNIILCFWGYKTKQKKNRNKQQKRKAEAEVKGTALETRKKKLDRDISKAWKEKICLGSKMEKYAHNLYKSKQICP